jgi:hypothetical protein
MRVWSGLAGLREVVEKLRPRLKVFKAESGTELFDLPDAPRPDPDTPAPPRLLPEYDNLLLSHQDRSRFFLDDVVPPGWAGNVMVDGFYAGHWQVQMERSTTRLDVSVKKVTKAEKSELEAEAWRMLGLIAPGDPGKEIRVSPLP